MWKNKILSLSALLILLSGCGIPPATPQDNTPTGTISATEIIPPSATKATITVTATIFENTSTPTLNLKRKATSTPYKEPTMTVDDNDEINRLYFWSSSQYGYLETDQFNKIINLISPIDPDVSSPRQALTLAFSRYSKKVAYLTEDDVIKLWIGDLDLQNVFQIQDDDHILGSELFPDYNDTRIIWGPNDLYLIIKSKPPVVYSLNSDTFYMLSSLCDKVGISPLSNKLSLWCPLDEQDQYLVLEQEASEWKANTNSKSDLVSVTDFVFSPDGGRVLVATPENDLWIMDEIGKMVKLPSTYIPPPLFVGVKTIQWSGNGEKLLIFGYHEEDVCPQVEGSSIPCWILRDVNTGVLLWFQPNRIFSLFDAALSSDGSRVAIFYNSDPNFKIEVGEVFSIDNDKSTLIFDYSVNTVYWDN